MDIRLSAACVFLAASAAATAGEPFVAHEWGTFTSVHVGDGQIWWEPTLQTDLPRFVYSRAVQNGGIHGVTLTQQGGKSGTAALLRMETPVIYFYSDIEREVDVRVDFPKGLVTEWYPRANSVGPYVLGSTREPSPSRIEWLDVRVLPPGTTEMSARGLIRDRADARADHYYAARDTDANFLRVTSMDKVPGVEHERDLFYRGLGYVEAPLDVKSSDTEVTLSTRSPAPMTEAFVFTVEHGKLRYQKAGTVSAGQSATVPLMPKSSGGREQLMNDVVASLERQGLFAKEARAMVATWRDQWFAEEGTRVLYLLPREWTDRTLPLQISPQPDRIVRVMVGRAEVLAPVRQRALRDQIIAYADGDSHARTRAVETTRELGYGRFLKPAVEMALGSPYDEHLARAGQSLAMAVKNARPALDKVVLNQP